MKYIKIGNFYLYTIDLSTRSAKTSFISQMTLNDTCSYCNTFTKEQADHIIDVLVNNGFAKDIIVLVDCKRED